MIARLAFLTSPAPNRFILNFQLEDGVTSIQFEISKAHLANILIDGTALALRGQFNRVQIPQTESAEHGAGA